MENICCFTGHRPQSLPWGFHEEDPRCLHLKHQLQKEILRAIQEEEIRHFLSGMALGFDIWAAEAVLQLQSAYPVTLECVLPCREQSAKWNRAARQRYQNILCRCNAVTLLQEAYTPDCFQRRNQYMVDHSHLVIALWNGRPSGTGNTVSYASAQGKPVWILRP